jgi:hypothetical protein
MKRFLLILLALLAVGGGIGGWWVLRDTPEKVLKDAVATLAGAKRLSRFELDVAVTDNTTRVTTGFAFVGQADLSDLVRPQALGVLRLAAKDPQSQDEDADLVLLSNKLAFRPRSAMPRSVARFKELVGAAPFAIVNRDEFLIRSGWPSLVGKGTDPKVRSSLQFAGPILQPQGGIVVSEDGTQETVEFTLDRNAVRPFLVNLVESWAGRRPTAAEYGWAQRASLDAGRGTYALTVDAATREPRFLDADIPLVREADNEIVGRIQATVAFEGFGDAVRIAAPAGAKDVTIALLRPNSTSTLPTSGDREGAVPVATGTAAATGVDLLQGKDIDVFSAYYDEIDNRGILQGEARARSRAMRRKR